MDEGKVFSKVIISGEHSVLRGGVAVVTPLKSHSLSYKIKPAEHFSLTYSEAVAPYEILIEGTFEKAFLLIKKSREAFKVNVHVDSLVPLGKGLGGSAALCVFVSRVLRAKGFLSEEKEFSFSVELENMFHGESSGVDIAGCLSSGPNSYVRGEGLKPIFSNLKGLLFGLSETGEVGDTEDCITQVLGLKVKNKDLFYSLDNNMNEASKSVSKAIEEGDAELLIKSFSNAAQVFKAWGLVTEKMKTLMNSLKAEGALVSKPTGSGLGGYVLSVWREEDREKAEQFCSELFEI